MYDTSAIKTPLDLLIKQVDKDYQNEKDGVCRVFLDDARIHMRRAQLAMRNATDALALVNERKAIDSADTT